MYALELQENRLLLTLVLSIEEYQIHVTFLYSFDRFVLYIEEKYRRSIVLCM